MIVYADVLICFNTVITYFILLAVKAVNRNKTKIIKVVLASLIGGFSSLYILLPQQNIFVEIMVKFILSGIITIVAFGFDCFKKFIRSLFFFFSISFIYAGFMLGFFYLLKPNGMVINNGVVYFQISPVILVVASVLFYYIMIFFKQFFSKKDEYAKNKIITLVYKNKEYIINCMVDSGDTIKDPMGLCEVVILDKINAQKIIGKEFCEMVLNFAVTEDIMLRVIPYKTINGDGLLPAIKIDFAIVDEQKKSNVLVGIVDYSFDGDFDGIISPEFIN